MKLIRINHQQVDVTLIDIEKVTGSQVKVKVSQRRPQTHCERDRP